jgi:hypothetical protein
LLIIPHGAHGLLLCATVASNARPTAGLNLGIAKIGHLVWCKRGDDLLDRGAVNQFFRSSARARPFIPFPIWRLNQKVFVLFGFPFFFWFGDFLLFSFFLGWLCVLKNTG